MSRNDIAACSAGAGIHSSNDQSVSFDKTVFEPKTSVGATHMNSPIYSGSDVSLDRSSKAMNDELLVLAAKSGDTAAFVELRRRHATKLLRTIYRVTRNWEDAEDALQDSFLKAYLHLNKFENRSTFASWLTRIAINSALMILRKKRPYEISIDATCAGFEAGDAMPSLEVLRVG